MCRPGHGFSRNLLTGGHIGPPLRGVGRCSGTNGNWRRTEAFPNGAGRSPPPTGATEQGGLRRGAPGVWPPPAKFRNGIWNGGVWSPRPTGATQVVPSNGPMYLGHGFRRPNFVPKFGASVRSSAPTEGLPKSQQRADVGIGPYEKESKPHQPPKPAAHSGASAARVRIAEEIIPKGVINAGQSLSQPAADSSLCTREPWGRGMRIAASLRSSQ